MYCSLKLQKCRLPTALKELVLVDVFSNWQNQLIWRDSEPSKTLFVDTVKMKTTSDARIRPIDSAIAKQNAVAEARVTSIPTSATGRLKTQTPVTPPMKQEVWDSLIKLLHIPNGELVQTDIH